MIPHPALLRAAEITLNSDLGLNAAQQTFLDAVRRVSSENVHFPHCDIFWSGSRERWSDGLAAALDAYEQTIEGLDEIEEIEVYIVIQAAE